MRRGSFGGMAMLGAALLAACVHGGQAAAPNPKPDFTADGYREARFRAPVTLDPAPAHQISLADAAALVPGTDTLFIDVLPVETGVRDLQTGEWRIASSHSTIPGAIWHPETGRAPPDPVLWAGLRDAIVKARDGQPDMPVILFCRIDCWMGWNAARRLASEGVPGIYWLAEGIEGWNDLGRSLAPAVPAIVPAPGEWPARS